MPKSREPDKQPGSDREHFWSAGGFGGNGVSGFDPTRSKNAMHPAGCGGCFLIKNATLGAQGSIDSTIFDDF